jgi:EamA-like transporter family
VSLSEASFIAMAKGLVAGSTNLVLALPSQTAWPPAGAVAAAALLGFASYGASLTLFVIALRYLGTARTAAYFSVAPFFGAVIAIVLLGDLVTPRLVSGGLLMAFGVCLHLTERHVHGHPHEVLEHVHEHVHGEGDEHHDHGHDEPVAPGTRHTHRHRHAAIRHSHPHFPDAHHRHSH